MILSCCNFQGFTYDYVFDWNIVKFGGTRQTESGESGANNGGNSGNGGNGGNGTPGTRPNSIFSNLLLLCNNL